MPRCRRRVCLSVALALALLAAVRALKVRGTANTDVGCMQIGLRHHLRAFASQNEAFDPTCHTA